MLGSGSFSKNLKVVYSSQGLRGYPGFLLAFFSKKDTILIHMVIRMRHTRAHTKNRRSHHKLGKASTTKNEKGVSHLRHRASAITGTYRGRKVVDIEAKIAKKEEKRKQKMKDLGQEEKKNEETA